MYAFFFREGKYRIAVRHPRNCPGFGSLDLTIFITKCANGKKYAVREKTEFFMSRSHIRGLQIGKNCVHSCGRCIGAKRLN